MYRKLSHVVYRCDYYIVFLPKSRFRILTGAIGELVERDVRVRGWKLSKRAPGKQLPAGVVGTMRWPRGRRDGRGPRNVE
jgi:hypothetical protein